MRPRIKLLTPASSFPVCRIFYVDSLYSSLSDDRAIDNGLPDRLNDMPGQSAWEYRICYAGVPVFSGRGRWHKSCCNHQSDYLGQTGRRQGLEKSKKHLQPTAQFVLIFPFSGPNLDSWPSLADKGPPAPPGGGPVENPWPPLKGEAWPPPQQNGTSTCLRSCAMVLWILDPFDLNHRWKRVCIFWTCSKIIICIVYCILYNYYIYYIMYYINWMMYLLYRYNIFSDKYIHCTL